MTREISVSFNPTTRVVSFSSLDAGSSADLSETVYKLDSATLALGGTADLVADVTAYVAGVMIKSPFARFGADGKTTMPRYILKACDGTLDLTVRLTFSDGTIVSSPVVTMTVDNVPDALDCSNDATLVMTAATSWEYRSGFTYAKGAVCVYNSILWTSKKDGNHAHTPVEGEWWTVAVDVSKIDGLAQEREARIAGDTALTTAISTEKSRAESAESALSSRIDNITISLDDTVTSTSSNGVKSSGIYSHVSTSSASALASAKTYADGAVSAEKTRAETAESALSARIDDIPSVVLDDTVTPTSSNGVKSSGISSHVSSVQSGLQTLISNESTRITNLSNGLGTVSSLDSGTSAGNVPVLGSDGKLPNSVIPAYAISTYAGTVDAKAKLTTLSDAETSDYAIVAGTASDDGTYILNGTYSTLTDWVRITTPSSIASWGNIGGTISAQTDLTSAIATAQGEALSSANTYTDNKVSPVSARVTAIEGDYLTASDIADMETTAHASQTYQPKGSYLTSAQASSTYLSKTDASTTYQPKGEYLTASEASQTYQPKGEYLTASALEPYAKSADVSSTYLSKTYAESTYQPIGDYATNELLNGVASIATDAQTTAVDASSNADLAISYANDAQTTADDALSKAEQNEGDITTLSDTITDLQTTVEGQGEVTAVAVTDAEIDGNTLSLKKSDGTVRATVTIPTGAGVTVSDYEPVGDEGNVGDLWIQRCGTVEDGDGGAF